MYSIGQIIQGIHDPELVIDELKFFINSKRKYDYAIHGAYSTSNIGDRSLAVSFRSQYSNTNQKVQIFPRKIGETKSNVHVLGGGGLLRDCETATNNKTPELLKKRLDWVSNKDKGAIIGIGVPGFKTKEAKNIAENKLEGVDLITVRDRWSLNNIKKYNNNVHLTACPAFLLKDPKKEMGCQTGVNFRPWPNYPSEIMSYHFGFEDMDVERKRREYIKNIQELCSKLKNPVFIPFHKQDESFARSNLNIKILSYTSSVKKTLERVSKMEKMVAMRYHSLVFSAITNTPVLALSYQPKVSHLANRINIPSYKPTEDRIDIAFKMPNGLDSMREHAFKNFELLNETFEE